MISDLPAQLGARLAVTDDAAWPLRTSRYIADAAGARGLIGCGAGKDREAAATRAVMELVERTAQFAPTSVPVATVDSYLRLGAEALCPEQLGLYSEGQYRAAGSRVTPFVPHQSLEWVQVTEVRTGRRRLVPVEFVYPRAVVTRGRLVVETSSGTAAGTTYEQALCGAISEVVERDSAMLFWHRRVPTHSIASQRLEPAIADELETVRQLGYELLACDLTYDLGIPVVLLLALRERSFAWGLGCDLDPSRAAAHALRELGARLRWLAVADSSETLHLPRGMVLTGEDHYRLYNRGPLHDTLRGFLTAVVRHPQPDEASTAHSLTAGDPAIGTHSGSSASGPHNDDPPPSDPPAAARLVDLLADAGYETYAHSLEAPSWDGDDFHVVRVIVPGLIPFWIGADMQRLGCHRLVGSTSPGHLTNLLPHMFG